MWPNATNHRAETFHNRRRTKYASVLLHWILLVNLNAFSNEDKARDVLILFISWNWSWNLSKFHNKLQRTKFSVNTHVMWHGISNQRRLFQSIIINTHNAFGGREKLLVKEGYSVRMYLWYHRETDSHPTLLWLLQRTPVNHKWYCVCIFLLFSRIVVEELGLSTCSWNIAGRHYRIGRVHVGSKLFA